MKKKVMAVAKYLWISAVVIFIVLYFYTHFDSVVNVIYAIPHFNLFIAFAALFFGKVLLSYVASLSVKYLDKDLPFPKMFAIYNITQLAKYIPGSIWQFVGKAGAYAKEGMNTSTIKKSILIEMLWVLSSAFVLGTVLVLSGDVLDVGFVISTTKDYYLIYGIAIIIVLIIAGYYYKRSVSFLRLIILKSSLNIEMSIILLFVWFLLGMSFFITLTPYIENVNMSMYIDIVGLYALAYAIGFLVPFAPAGIGIREAVLVAGLSTLMSVEQAVVLASLNRIIYIILEVTIVIALLSYRHVKKGHT